MKKHLPLIGVLLIGGGLFFLGWFARVITTPAEVPYNYRLIKQGTPKDFSNLGMKLGDGVRVEKYALHVTDIDKQVVEFYVARDGDTSPVLLDWENLAAEPVIRLTTNASETERLVQAVKNHVPGDAVVLTWWDTSQRLSLMTDARLLFNENLAQPLFVPKPWRDKEELIRVAEAKFWKGGTEKKDILPFGLYLDALVSDVPSGVDKLHQLAGDSETYLIVHLRDAYQLGALRAEEFGIGYKDFPWSGNTHGMISSVKNWLKENGYDAYSVERFEDNTTRVYFLTDTKSTKSLMAQILPFSTSRPMAVDNLELVFQNGGYWVYKLLRS